MAHIIEETVVITFSKITKGKTDDTKSILPDELLATLESVAQELVGENIVVEISK